jgi:hypothetical protein
MYITIGLVVAVVMFMFVPQVVASVKFIVFARKYAPILQSISAHIYQDYLLGNIDEETATKQIQEKIDEAVNGDQSNIYTLNINKVGLLRAVMTDLNINRKKLAKEA